MLAPDFRPPKRKRPPRLRRGSLSEPRNDRQRDYLAGAASAGFESAGGAVFLSASFLPFLCFLEAAGLASSACAAKETRAKAAAREAAIVRIIVGLLGRWLERSSPTWIVLSKTCACRGARMILVKPIGCQTG